MVERKLKGYIGVGIRARNRNQRKLEWPLLARFVERDYVRQLVGHDIFDPVVAAAQLKIQTGGPNGHSIRIIIGPTIAQPVRAVEYHNVDSAEIVVIVVG